MPLSGDEKGEAMALSMARAKPSYNRAGAWLRRDALSLAALTDVRMKTARSTQNAGIRRMAAKGFL
jgi:hypothetical protein